MTQLLLALLLVLALLALLLLRLLHLVYLTWFQSMLANTPPLLIAYTTCNTSCWLCSTQKGSRHAGSNQLMCTEWY